LTISIRIKISEIEKKHAAELKKKTSEVQVLRGQLEESRLESEVLREQIEEQNRLIVRLENGLKLAMDQIDYLTANLSGANQSGASQAPSRTPPIIEEYEDDINYDDLDEETLMQLLAQTRQALMEKRSSVTSSLDTLSFLNLDS